MDDDSASVTLQRVSPDVERIAVASVSTRRRLTSPSGATVMAAVSS